MKLYIERRRDATPFLIIPSMWWLTKRRKDTLMISWLKLEIHLHLRGV
jgi:hypothetical protein